MDVLIVDDSKVARRILSDYMQMFGHMVVAEAVDGLDGLQKYKEFKPELIISDLEMPNLDGVEMIKQIREIDESSKIIVVSSVMSKKVVHKALLAGASNVVPKPIDKEQLKKSIDGGE